MISAHITICALVMGALSVIAHGDNMLGPGRWRVLKVEKCAGVFPVDVEVARRKVNRTHDGFNVKLNMDNDFDETYAVRIDICKQVDGGCKPYQVLADDSLQRFVTKYAGDNVRDFLSMAGVDPPDFPVPKGSYEVSNFVFNYEELPSDAIYGVFGAEAVVLKDSQSVSCVFLDVEFVEIDDSDER